MANTWSCPPAAGNALQPLVIALTQYPVLENLVAHLRPDDLVMFTTIAQVIHGQFRMHEANAKANLLSKTLCPGVGLAIRESIHCPCRTKHWNKYAGCAGDGYDAPSRPCTDCGINTCDECRTHVVYQVYMDDNGLEGRRWWAGYAFLRPFPFGMYPSKAGDTKSWHLPPGATKSHHDQGRFHVPLHIDGLADPEPIDRILDLDLGCRRVTPRGRTEAPFDGENLVSLFSMFACHRVETVCPPCSREHEGEGLVSCSCTLRKRFLDRWLCLQCYVKEHKADIELEKHNVRDRITGHIHSRTCRCGVTITADDDHVVICNWCKGVIAYDESDSDADLDDQGGDNVANTFSTTDEQDPNAATAPPDMAPHHMYFGYNKDGTLSVFYEDMRITGEPLGHEMIAHVARHHGKDLPCTCCRCPAVDDLDHHNHGHDGDEDEEMGEEADDEVEEMAEGGTGDGYDDDAIDFDEEVEPDLYDDEAMASDEEVEPDL